MSKLELMTVLHSLDELHEMNQPEAAHRVIKKVIAEARGQVLDISSESDS
jgi:hypothetical protein